MVGDDGKVAVEALQPCLAQAPQMCVARLGLALKRLGQSHEALVAHFSAINVAQAWGR
jgi:hypothetical protein